MSVDATRWAWRAPVKNATQRLILLSLADRAGEHHTCYPSNKRLAEDTMLNLKTVQKSVCELIELGLIIDTGERKGNTNQIRVLQLIGVDSRECNEPKNGAVKQTQKRNSTKNGNDTKFGHETSPNLDTKRSQNWDTESVIEPNIEPTLSGGDGFVSDAAKTRMGLPTGSGIPFPAQFKPSAEHIAMAAEKPVAY